jgi:hypothetical protein
MAEDENASDPQEVCSSGEVRWVAFRGGVVTTKTTEVVLVEIGQLTDMTFKVGRGNDSSSFERVPTS